MSSKQDSQKPEHKTKKFGKGERSIPHHTQKAKKFYPAEDENKPRKVSTYSCSLSILWSGEALAKQAGCLLSINRALNAQSSY